MSCAFLVAVFALFPTLILADDPSSNVEIRVEPSEIYEGESTLLTATVVNTTLDKDPDISSLTSDFDVVTLEPTKRSSIRTFYNGSEERREEKRITEYRFQLTPQKAGDYVVKAPEMYVEGKLLEAKTVTLKVKESSHTDLVILETSVSPEGSVYPLVPFEVSVNVFVKEAPEKYQTSNILELIVNNLGAPNLTIPWLQSRNIISGTIEDVELEEWLSQLSNKRYGFTLNNFQLSRDVFDFSFSFFDDHRQSAMFLPKAESVERVNDVGEPVKYQKYSFVRKLRASKPQTLNFPSSILKGYFIDFSDLSEPTQLPIFLTSKPVSVTVKAIPEEKAPEDYIGVYGNIKQSVDISSNDVAVGDAFTLTVSLQGYGSFEGAKAPELRDEFPPDDFKIYQASERSLENGVAFDYKIRPVKSGRLTVPSIRTSYFNVEKGEFVREESQPITMTIRESLLPTDRSSLFEISKDETPNSDSFMGAEELKRASQSKRIFSIVVITAIGLIVFFIILLSRKMLAYYNLRVEASNKRICEAAQHTLTEGLNKINESPTAGIQLLRIAFVQLIGKRFTQSIDALTDAEIISFFDNELNEKRPSSRAFKLENDDAS
ncbi:MAG: BatD family protein, partial [Thermoguttaceae bacterium]|nr:BatD family protein [Thermoguttaceae bacterium]